MNESLVLKSSLALAVTPCKTACGGSSSSSSLSVASTSPTVYASGGAHCAFSSNLIHGQITQKHINQMSSPENKKCSP